MVDIHQNITIRNKSSMNMKYFCFYTVVTGLKFTEILPSEATVVFKLKSTVVQLSIYS